MKLTSITFTGIDEKTDLSRVESIQEQYPYVEWGVLLSYHWNENGNRYPSPKLIEKLEYKGLRLSAHICGSMAKDIVINCETEKMLETINYNFDLFRRCQMNVNTCALFRELRTMRPFDRMLDEVILQMSNSSTLDSFLRYVEVPTPRISYLIEGSGGRGIDCDITVFDNPDLHIGYAGGINPENVGPKLMKLLEHPSYGKFWIDMETGVRTDDWLDLDKVEKVLEICDPIIKEHEKNYKRK